MRTYRLVVACGVITLAGSAAAADFKLVAHPSVPVASLSRAAVSSAFLKKTDKWPNGTPIVPVEQGSQLRLSFCRDVHNKSLAMVDSYWQKQVFSGRSSPPVTRGSDADVIAYVRSSPGAIGYVSAGAEAAGLKEIRIE